MSTFTADGDDIILWTLALGTPLASTPALPCHPGPAQLHLLPGLRLTFGHLTHQYQQHLHISSVKL